MSRYCLRKITGSPTSRGKRFAVVRGGVYTTNRRLKKMGHLRVGWLFLWTAMNYWNEKYFLRDHKYWAEPGSLPRA